MRVVLGLGATFVPAQHQLTIKDGALQRCVGGSNSAPGQTFAVASPAGSELPQVFISGPSVTSLCNPLVLQALTPLVGGRHPTYAWLLPRNLDPSFAPESLDGAVLEVDPLAFGDGGEFEFALRVTNYLGQTSSLATLRVTATNKPLPLIFPTSATTVFTTSTQTIRLYNSITSNPCFAEPLKPLVFAWTLTPPLPEGHSVVLDQANLVLPRNQLTPSTEYTATLRVSLATNPALASTLDYHLHIEPAALKAVIRGGEWRKVRQDAEGWTLDASLSSDDDALSVQALLADFGRVSRGANADGVEQSPITSLGESDYAADKYAFAWTCTAQDGGACLSALTGQPLALEAKPLLTFPKNALRIGQYRFELTYSHLPSGRQSQTATLISIREGVSPQSFGALGTVDVLLDQSADMVNPEGKILLQAYLPPYYADRTDDLVWTWSVLGGGATPFNIDDPTNIQGQGTDTLLLNPSAVARFFVPGTDYHFRVTVHHAEDVAAAADAGQAMAYVRINSLPACDSLVASPAEEGTAFNTSYALQAASCYDPDTRDLLAYQFFRIDDQASHFDLLPLSQAPVGRVPFLPTGSRANDYVLTLGVTVSDRLGGRSEYTRDVKVVPNPALEGEGLRPLAQLKQVYQQTWAPSMAVSGDTQMHLVVLAAILTEANELSTHTQLSPQELTELLDFKRQILETISGLAALQPASQVLQAVGELVSESRSLDLPLLSAALQFLAARAGADKGFALDGDQAREYAAVVKMAMDYVLVTTGASAQPGARRLFSMEAAVGAAPEMAGMAAGRAFAAMDVASPQSVLSEAYALLNLLGQDISARVLTMRDEVVQVNLENSAAFRGMVGRASVGRASNLTTAGGYGVVTSAAGMATLAAGTFVDFALWVSQPAPYVGLVPENVRAQLVSGGASVNAYLPSSPRGAESAPVTEFTGVEVELPFSLTIDQCVEGDEFVPHPNDAPAPANVFGNMCKLSCRVWDGSSFSDAAVTMLAVRPLSRKVVCGVSGPGLVVAHYDRLPEPYVRPPDTVTDPSTDPQSKFQPNGLPWGVVRALMVVQPAPTIFDLQAFKGQISTDLGQMVGQPQQRSLVQQVSAANGAVTVIWDFVAAAAEGDKQSQELYDTLAGMSKRDFASTVYMKDVEPESIMQFCDDQQYRRDCSSAPSLWSKMELPVIIAVCCFVLVCCLASILFACIKCRRARHAKMQPPLVEGDVQPAKKFVYTAPNGEQASEESISEVTLRPQGAEFEPSHHPVSQEDSGNGSKNRLQAKFPQKTPMAAAVPQTPKEESKQSQHHFYYVDESKKETPSGRRISRQGTQSHFTVEGSQSRELSNSHSHSSSSRNSLAGVAAGPTPNSGKPESPSEASRKDSLGEKDKMAALEVDKDKAPLPILRPIRSPMQAQK